MICTSKERSTLEVNGLDCLYVSDWNTILKHKNLREIGLLCKHRKKEKWKRSGELLKKSSDNLY